MANPQLEEEGHVKIVNSIMEALARIRIPGEARQVLDFVIRKTYGWNKKNDWINLDQFAFGTGLSKVHVCRGIDVLVRMNLVLRKNESFTQKGNVTQKGNGNLISYEFQKDYEKWKPLPKKVTLPKKVKSFTQKGNKPFTQKGNIQKTYIKEPKDNTKDKDAAFFEIFWKCYPSRNGKKVEKAETFSRYCDLSEADQELINRAAGNYAQSEMVRAGIGIKDPKRFIRDGHGNEPWRDWIEPEHKENQDEDWIERWSKSSSGA